MTKSIKIAHITDIHTGSQYFVNNLLTRVVKELNDLKPDVLIVTGDLTTMGFKQEFTTAKAFIDRIEVKHKVVIPGNHDSRNVGYVHFEDLFGPRNLSLKVEGLTIVAVDSSEPDLDTGSIGRERYEWVKEQFSESDGVRIFAIHHHLLPVPGTGRERSTINDAADVLEVLLDCNVDMSISGHKHVPWSWRFENMVVTTAATCSTLRLRGNIKPSYNIYEISGKTISIHRQYPYGERDTMAIFEKAGEGKHYLKWRRARLRSLIVKGIEEPAETGNI
ncbi:MAG: metallophosphoesterase [Actinobacteria bacterium]|nr:MAG: metallophosphoesterase [Actinomycetota bacterium]